MGLSPEQRAEIRAELEKPKLLLAHYDCNGIELLPECTLPGEYRYSGAKPSKRGFQISDDAELIANLELGAAELADDMGQGRWRGQVLDLTVGSVGNRTTVRKSVDRSELKGRCERATHFVRSVQVGAFGLDRIRAGASLPSGVAVAKAAAAALVRHPIRGEGSLRACMSAPADATSPPIGCSVPVRAELVPLAAGPAQATAASPSDGMDTSCPPGTHLTDGGKCVADASGAPYMCEFENVADCELQCQRGSMSSCAVLGRSYEIGRGVPVDIDKATALYERACRADVTPACGRLGARLLGGGRRTEGLELLFRSCRAGWGDACYIAAADAMSRGSKIDVGGLLTRSCDAGDAEGCLGLGLAFQEGLGVPKNQAEALRRLKMACDGDARIGCSAYANALESGAGAPPDPDGAIAILQRACDRGYSSSCNALSVHYLTGTHVPKDIALGVRLLERACEGTDRESCVVIGMRYANGVDVPRDVAKATHFFQRGCDTGSSPSCLALKAQKK